MEKKMRGLPFARTKSTINRVVGRLNLDYHETIKRTHLTERHIQRREHFAEIIELDVCYMLPRFFTDECMIDLNPYGTGDRD
jgi:hypothetical protein